MCHYKRLSTFTFDSELQLVSVDSRWVCHLQGQQVGRVVPHVISCLANEPHKFADVEPVIGELCVCTKCWMMTLKYNATIIETLKTSFHNPQQKRHAIIGEI